MSKITLDAYLFFTGNCRQAMEFYHSIFGGDLKIQTNGEVPGEQTEEMKAKADNVMHAQLSGGLIDLMGSDGTRTEPYDVSNISLSLSGTDHQQLEEIFNKLAEGGKVVAPLKKEFWGDTFGMVTDKFGTDWMVNISAPSAE